MRIRSGHRAPRLALHQEGAGVRVHPGAGLRSIRPVRPSSGPSRRLLAGLGFGPRSRRDRHPAGTPPAGLEEQERSMPCPVRTFQETRPRAVGAFSPWPAGIAGSATAGGGRDPRRSPAEPGVRCRRAGSPSPTRTRAPPDAETGAVPPPPHVEHDRGARPSCRCARGGHGGANCGLTGHTCALRGRCPCRRADADGDQGAAVPGHAGPGSRQGGAGAAPGLAPATGRSGARRPSQLAARPDGCGAQRDRPSAGSPGTLRSDWPAGADLTKRGASSRARRPFQTAPESEWPLNERRCVDLKSGEPPLTANTGYRDERNARIIREAAG